MASILKCGLLFSALMALSYLYTCTSSRYSEVRLPNGYTVGPELFGNFSSMHNAIRVRDNGKTVVPAGVMEFQWDENAVYGYRLEGTKNRLFLYQRGKAYIEMDEATELERLLKARGLRTLAFNKATTYWTLRTDPTTRQDSLPGAPTLRQMLQFLAKNI